jgi:hypothetical protein
VNEVLEWQRWEARWIRAAATRGGPDHSGGKERWARSDRW